MKKGEKVICLVLSLVLLAGMIRIVDAKAANALSYTLAFYKGSAAEANKVSAGPRLNEITVPENGDIIGTMLLDTGSEKAITQKPYQFIMAAYRNSTLVGLDVSNRSNILLYDDFEDESTAEAVQAKWDGTGDAALNALGIAYGVTGAALPLPPGESETDNKYFHPVDADGGNSTVNLKKNFSSAVNGLYEAYFYDTAGQSINNRGAIGVSGTNAGSSAVTVYLGLAQSTSSGTSEEKAKAKANYQVKINSTCNYVKERTEGWHKFTLDFTSGNGFQAFIDDALVYPTPANPNDYDESLQSFTSASVGTNNWDGTAAYFDNVTVRVNDPTTLTIPGLQAGDTVKWFTWNGFDTMIPAVPPRDPDAAGGQ